MSDNPRHDGPNFDTPIIDGPLGGSDFPKVDAEVSGSAWALADADCGCSEGPSYDSEYAGGCGGKTEGQIDVAMSVNARQAIPYQHNFHDQADISFAPGRVDVPDPKPDSGVPALFHGEQGQPLPFDQVAPERGPHGDMAPDGTPVPDGAVASFLDPHIID